MGYPQRLLGSGEEIVREMRPHWRVLLPAALVLLVTVPVTSFLAAAVGDESWWLWVRWAIVAVGALVVLRWVLVPFLRWTTTQYVFTTRRIVTRGGLIRRYGRDMPVSRVNNVSFTKSLLERLLNSGTLVVESASEYGALVISHVRDVEDVAREVYRLHEEDDAWRRAARD